MGWPLFAGLALGGAALGAGAGMLGKKGKYEIDPYGAWNPEQKAIGKTALPGYLQSGFPQYDASKFAAPMTQGEQDILNQNSRMSALLGEGSMNAMMSGQWTPEWENMYQQSIYKPLMKQFQEDIQPQIEEQYAGPGGYWGGARADAVRKGYRDVQDTLAAKRAELGLEAFQSPLKAAPVMQNWQTASESLQQVPRLIQQYKLDQQYQDWLRSVPGGPQWLDTALKFLDINSQTSTYKPPEDTFLSGFMRNLGGMAMGMGAQGLGNTLSGASGSAAGAIQNVGQTGATGMSTAMSNPAAWAATNPALASAGSASALGMIGNPAAYLGSATANIANRYSPAIIDWLKSNYQY